MKTKSILTQNGKLLFLNNIISLEIVEAAEYYSGALSAYTDDLESVIIAEDVNENEIFVGEYLNESAAEDVIKI